VLTDRDAGVTVMRLRATVVVEISVVADPLETTTLALAFMFEYAA
jgi:hypothetical protein